MRRLDAGIAGVAEGVPEVSWRAMDLDSAWVEIAARLSTSETARHAQWLALTEVHLLESRRNLIVSSPTNSGKSLIGWLMLLASIQRGRRAILVEPLRAIAGEKAQEISAIAQELGQLLGTDLTITVSTGDYRLNDEQLSSPPPNQGELIIATPERLEAILRNPRYQPWIESVGAICIDEAHLISSPRRGPVLEHVITTFLSMPNPPRIALLSATVGNVTRAQAWLAPCDIVGVAERYPPLHKEVFSLDSDEDGNAIVCGLAEEILADPRASLLVFVYQTRAAESLAEQLCGALQEDMVGELGALAYHAKMSSEQRTNVQEQYRTGQCRCLVTTSALGLGVNLPASHVIVRDTTYSGVGVLSAGDLLQMMGRAGRGDQAGYAIAIVRENDGWDADELADHLRREQVNELVSAHERTSQNSWQRPKSVEIDSAAAIIASLLSRWSDNGATQDDLAFYLSRSLGSAMLSARLPIALAWLTDPMRVLAFRDEQERYHLTTLGRRATRAMLPLNVAASVGQLMRDLLTIDPSDQLLGRWQPMDHLIMLDLAFGRAPHLRPFGQNLAEQVDSWMERQLGMQSLLYVEWIRGAKDHSKADQLLGSLGVEQGEGRQPQGEWARRRAYLALFRAIILYERSHGVSRDELTRQWKLRNLAGIEERWRDDTIWLLSGMAEMLEIRSFFYHLRANCDASPERIQRVKRQISAKRRQTQLLMDGLKYCSSLGSVLHEIRRTQNGAGAKMGATTVRRLEDAGVQHVGDLRGMSVENLVALGIQKRYAGQIVTYVKRREG